MSSYSIETIPTVLTLSKKLLKLCKGIQDKIFYTADCIYLLIDRQILRPIPIPEAMLM